MLADKLYNAYKTKSKPNVLVIGDLMLDHYIFGSANRLSPEAPVPVININKETKIVGGAANVASNLKELGANVYLAGLTGDDIYGEEIKSILDSNQIDTSLIIKDNTRLTTIKTRVIAGNHHIVRIDKEDIHEISKELESIFLQTVEECIKKADIIILSDYNKGLLSQNLCLRIIELCKQNNKKVVVDPKGLDYSKYQGAYIIKPNRKELAEASKTERITNNEALVKAADVIFKITQAEYLVVTLSEAGIAIISNQAHKVIPVVATEVYDVTGAGDTVIATLAYCLAMGFDIEEAATIANYAAAIVIKHIGSATTTIEEVIQSLDK
ncbi:D-glycero-beta-D-manno-heptose-7-phosphate kinase [Pedobacter punctiformis]|uniref:D-glycero-beta-D-manno-heptose-7-phosphate kinase n=1 Tax=Pedobacter punctiformis TaxID=3004097 RepID=A0ABT4L8S2_9SPHI|nr:D-glycero-beta-D-manno-heptose-7-phosphate kinase [Pedobacter sp. HCMS5-2]MCZ4244314.1 D-glycero-beta-D-manno-heptose-7-phosphate kinase [Pedobacter sp. HCMS5-2]